MDARYQKVGMMSLIACVMVIGPGCSSDAVRYSVDSEAVEEKAMEEEGTMQKGMVAEQEQSSVPVSEYWKGRTFEQGGESMDADAMNQPMAYNRPPQLGGTSDYIAKMKKGDPDYNSLQYFTPGMEGAEGGSDYQHDYAGVAGRRDDHGPVTGFSDGSASSMNMDPDEWARAQIGGAYSSDGLTPEYVEENSVIADASEGLTPEHVEQDMVIARADVEGRQGELSEGRGGLYKDPQSLGFGSKDLEYVRGVSLNNGEVRDIFFEFDSWKITSQGALALESDADWMKAHPDEIVTIEGHCDQRGTQNYNLVLGKKRAEATRDYLVDLGVKPSQLKIVSYGKERPFCSEQSEDCYQQNRRGHMVSSMN